MDGALAKVFSPDPDLKHCEEYDVWLKLSRHAMDYGKGIYYCPHVTAVYRLHKEQNWEKARKLGRQKRTQMRAKIQERHK